MGLISGIFMGMVFGIALMAGWKRMMRYRSAKRIAKVWMIVSSICVDFGFADQYLRDSVDFSVLGNVGGRK